MRCEWAVPDEVDPSGQCPRQASVLLHPMRPCGHEEGCAASCPGHAEAIVGETAKRATECRVCGVMNFPAALPEYVEAIPRG